MADIRIRFRFLITPICMTPRYVDDKQYCVWRFIQCDISKQKQVTESYHQLLQIREESITKSASADTGQCIHLQVEGILSVPWYLCLYSVDIIIIIINIIEIRNTIGKLSPSQLSNLQLSWAEIALLSELWGTYIIHHTAYTIHPE